MLESAVFPITLKFPYVTGLLSYGPLCRNENNTFGEGLLKCTSIAGYMKEPAVEAVRPYGRNDPEDKDKTISRNFGKH